MSSGALYIGDLEEGCGFAKVFSQEIIPNYNLSTPRYAINQTSPLEDNATHVI